MRITLTAAALLLAAATSVAAGEYQLPRSWSEKDGNPLVVNGKPRWRIDHIWPDDPLVFANYQPMSWREGQWITDTGTFGGQPSAGMTEGRVFRIDSRGPWAAQEGKKTAALVFIAPVRGSYTVQGKVDIDRWSGEGDPALTIVRRWVSKEKVKTLKLAPVAVKAGNVFSTKSEMEAGDEIVIAGEVPAWHTTAKFTFRDLSIFGP